MMEDAFSFLGFKFHISFEFGFLGVEYLCFTLGFMADVCGGMRLFVTDYKCESTHPTLSVSISIEHTYLAMSL